MDKFDKNDYLVCENCEKFMNFSHQQQRAWEGLQKGSEYEVRIQSNGEKFYIMTRCKVCLPLGCKNCQDVEEFVSCILHYNTEEEKNERIEFIQMYTRKRNITLQFSYGSGEWCIYHCFNCSYANNELYHACDDEHNCAESGCFIPKYFSRDCEINMTANDGYDDYTCNHRNKKKKTAQKKRKRNYETKPKKGKLFNPVPREYLDTIDTYVEVVRFR